jgi:predicted dehydrogenase
MNNQPYVGLIECEPTEKSFTSRTAELPQNFNLKKAFAIHESAGISLQRRFPEIELTADCSAIFSDSNISLVLISAPANKHNDLIGAALKANKHVQLV